MNPYTGLLDLFNDKNKTQLMRQAVDLLGLKYIKFDDFLFLHSYFERKDSFSINPYFQAVAQVHQIKKTDVGVELTIKAVKDEFDQQAIKLLQSVEEDKLEISYSHLLPNLVTPNIQDGAWDNWYFAYKGSPEEKLEKRRARTRKLCAKLYRSLERKDFRGKNILFLGCGDGDEVEAFISKFDVSDADILGIDQSLTAIKNCKKISQSKINAKLNFQQLNFADLNELSKDRFDLIVAIGIFDRETLSFSTGQKLLKVVSKNINFDEMLCCAYSFELFSTQNYRDMGFDVIATCEPKYIYTPEDNFFYLIKKSLNQIEHRQSEIPDAVGDASISFWQQS